MNNFSHARQNTYMEVIVHFLMKNRVLELSKNEIWAKFGTNIVFKALRIMLACSDQYIVEHSARH